MQHSARYCEWKKANCLEDRNRAPCAECMYMTGNTDYMLMHMMGCLVGAIRILGGMKCPPNKEDCGGAQLSCTACWHRWLYQPNSGMEIKAYARSFCERKRKVKVYIRKGKKTYVGG